MIHKSNKIEKAEVEQACYEAGDDAVEIKIQAALTALQTTFGSMMEEKLGGSMEEIEITEDATPMQEMQEQKEEAKSNEKEKKEARNKEKEIVLHLNILHNVKH